MGFLTVNTRKRVKNTTPGRSKRSKRNTPPSSRVSSSSPSTISRPASISPPPIAHVSDLTAIERLPREILEYIFVLSGNFNLPQASLTLAQKLYRTRSLELAIVRSQLRMHQNKLPTHVVRWPFINTSLLSELEFSRFVGSFTNGRESDPYVPYAIEKKLELEDEFVDLAAFMVERGCRVEDSIKIYKIFARKGYWRAVSAMASSKHRTDLEVIVLALKAGQGPEMAIQLLNLAHGVLDVTEIWAVQQAALEARVPEVNAYLNAG